MTSLYECFYLLNAVYSSTVFSAYPFWTCLPLVTHVKTFFVSEEQGFNYFKTVMQ